MIIGLSHRARGPAVLRALLIGSAMIPLAIGIARAEPVDGPAATAAPAPRGNASITGTISQAGSGDYLDGEWHAVSRDAGHDVMKLSPPCHHAAIGLQ